MFTGLVEKVGHLRGIRRSGGGASFEIECGEWDNALELGESVAVQGTCLTVTSAGDGGFTCDVLDETLNRTNLGDKAVGAALNLERALKMGDRLGGHLVSGHVEAVGCPAELAVGIIEKGSVAIDGISLTVSAVGDDWFEVNIIPFTWEHTSLAERKVGDSVNLETDMLGKYVKRYVDAVAGGGSLSLEKLAAAGFV